MPFKRVSFVLQSRFGFPGSADERFLGEALAEIAHRYFYLNPVMFFAASNSKSDTFSFTASKVWA